VAISPPISSIPAPTSKPESTPIKSESTSSADMSNWKTYENTIGRFSFQYPPNFKICSENQLTKYGGNRRGDVGMISILDCPASFHQTGSALLKPSQVYFVVAAELQNGKTLEQLINGNSHMASDNTKNALSLTVNGKQAYMLTAPNAFECYSNIFTLNNNMFYNICFQTEETAPADTKFMIDQILSTFKFTDQNNTNTDSSVLSVVKDYALKGGFKKPIITTDFIKDTQARGDLGDEGVPGSGAKWFVAKINGQWTVVWVGNGNPSCSEVSKYNLPKDFLNCY